MVTQTVQAVCANAYEYIIDIKIQRSRANKTLMHKLQKNINKHIYKLSL
jgi:hypothetical protein